MTNIQTSVAPCSLSVDAPAICVLPEMFSPRHLVGFGGTLLAYLGGMHYWWPKITGKLYSEPWAKTAAVIVFVSTPPLDQVLHTHSHPFALITS